MTVTITEYADNHQPLVLIPKDEWPSALRHRIEWVKHSLDYDLEMSLRYISEFEELSVWTTLKESRENFFRFMCGLAPDEIEPLREGLRIVREKGWSGLVTRLDVRTALADKARADKDQADANKRGGQGGVLLPDNVKKQEDDGGNSASYLRRRLARMAPEVLEAWERGEFVSVRAAAKEAGIVRDATPLELLHRAWKRASESERAKFLKTITINEMAGS